MAQEQKTLRIYKTNQPIAYSTAYDIAVDLQNQVISGADDAIWLLQHKHVYTLGRGAKESEILHRNEGVEVVNINRGGKVTYHGPGQRVIYIYIDVKRLMNGKPDLRLFVKMLEHWLIDALGQCGVQCFLHPEHIGIWTKHSTDATEGRINKTSPISKIAAIGIHIKKWVTSHGVAINFSNDLQYYNNIVPCGITQHGVTSLKQTNAHVNNMDELDKILMNTFASHFCYKTPSSISNI